MSQSSTKKKLLSLVDDVEIIAKELFEIISLPEQQRTEGIDMEQLTDLLVNKDNEIKEMLKVAEEQTELQQKVAGLQAEVAKYDQDIKLLQKALKDAETLLSNAIYQANQKLASVRQANAHKISSEDLIKYAHKISASNTVAAPPTWAPGDPRRPYPTEIEMRRGWLARLSSDMPITSLPTPSQYVEPLARNTHIDLPAVPPAFGSPPGLSWQASIEKSSISTTPGHMVKPEPKVHQRVIEEVEIMSSDSSSSSSSDE